MPDEKEYKKKLLDFILGQHPAEEAGYNHAGETLDALRPVMQHKINRGLLECSGCCDCSKAIRSVMRGPAGAPVLVVTEGIMKEQLELGKEVVLPLEGTAELGLVERAFREHGLEPDKLLWLNRVNCFCEKTADGRNFPGVPGSRMVKSCSQWLKYTVKYLDPLAVILLGTGPLASFFPGEKMADAHGRTRNLDFYDIAVFPLYSPCRVLAEMKKGNRKFYEEFSADVKSMAAELRHL